MLMTMAFGGSDRDSTRPDPRETETKSQAPHSAPPRTPLAIEIDLTSESHFFAGLSGDVSEGGLFLATYLPLAIGREVAVELSLPGLPRALRACGSVRWIREHSPHQPRGVGIVFDDLSDECRASIDAFCRSRPALYYEDV